MEQAQEENNHRESGGSLAAALRFSSGGMRGQNRAGTGTGDTGRDRDHAAKH